MITLARESRGLTQKELSDKISISQGKLSKIEHGMISVDEATLDLLSKELEYPIRFFYDKSLVYPSSIGLHRKRKALPKKVQDVISANINIQRIQIAKLLKAVDIPSNIPFYDLEECDSPQHAARMVRQAWVMPSGPVSNIVKIMEDAGIIIVGFDFNSPLIDGVTLYVDNLPPMIFVNRTFPPDRLRFTLSHELGHIVLHRIPTPDMENEANLFASEFLMPAEEIKDSLYNLTVPKLYSLKRYWKVSMASIITLATQLGSIDSNKKKYLWMKLSALGYRKNEPGSNEIEKEELSLLREIVDFHLTDLGYNEDELSELMLLYKKEFVLKYSKSESKKLRIVK